LKGSAKGYVKS